MWQKLGIVAFHVKLYSVPDLGMSGYATAHGSSIRGVHRPTELFLLVRGIRNGAEACGPPTTHRIWASWVNPAMALSVFYYPKQELLIC